MIFIGASTLLCGDEFCGMITPVNPINATEVVLSNFVIDEVYIENKSDYTPYEEVIDIIDDYNIVDHVEPGVFVNRTNHEYGNYVFSYNPLGYWEMYCDDPSQKSYVNLVDYGVVLNSSYIPYDDDTFTIDYYLKAIDIPDWGFDTIFDAKFKNSVSAGNLDWTLETTNGLLIKRHSLTDDNDNWISIKYIPVSTIEDFIFTGYDYGATSGTYEYAIVPLNDRIEGAYTASMPIDVVVSRLTIIDSDSYKSTPITDGSCNTTYVVPSMPVETLYNKYPSITSNSSICYQTIEVSGSFYPDVCNQEDGIFNDVNRVKYINEVLKMLTNRKPKILKNIDGRIWLVWITTPPSDTAADFYKLRTITFGCTEIGDINSEKNLYECNFINVPRIYWNTYQ